MFLTLPDGGPFAFAGLWETWDDKGKDEVRGAFSTAPRRLIGGCMIVPYDKLSPEALQGLIEEFVTRPGTDTGYTEGSLEGDVDMVMRQLKRGDVFIVYDAKSKTANIVPKDQLKKAGLEKRNCSRG